MSRLVNPPPSGVFVREPLDSLGMTAPESSKMAGSCSVPIEKPPRCRGACAPVFCQFALELFSSALPAGLTVPEDFGVDERQKPYMRLELLGHLLDEGFNEFAAADVAGVAGGGLSSFDSPARGSFAA